MNDANGTPHDPDLTRLADGTLPDAQAARLRARVDADPELQAGLREQQHAVELTRTTRQLTAPPTLHRAVAAQLSARSTPRGPARAVWRPRRLAPLAAGGLAVVILVIVLLSSGTRTLTVNRTARLALAAPTRSAPTVDPRDSDLLSLRVDSIPFPAYERHRDWRATGARDDETDARHVQTVFYDIAGARVGYAIVSGAALRVPRGRVRTLDGVRYVITGVGSAEFVTWQRAGHTCVIASRQVNAGTLLRLATASRTSA